MKKLDEILAKLSKESESNYPVDLNARNTQIEVARTAILSLIKSKQNRKGNKKRRRR